jgi:uncharacterized protein (TIGR02265 family)
MSQSNPAVAPYAPGGREPTEYDRRLPHAGPDDTVRGLFFNGVFSAVSTVGGEQGLIQCHKLLDDPMFNRRFVDFSSYPVRDFLRLASAAVAVLAPKVGGLPQAHHHIGEQAIDDFFRSMAGRTLLLLSGNSPQRILSHLPSGYSTAVSYGQRKVTMLGDNGARVTYEDDLMPPLHNEGVLLGILRAVNAKNPRVRSQPRGLLDCEYTLTWEP